MIVGARLAALVDPLSVVSVSLGIVVVLDSVVYATNHDLVGEHGRVWAHWLLSEHSMRGYCSIDTAQSVLG